MKRKVFGCGSFFNENDLFEIKLNQQQAFVDTFIVLEVGETHTGDKKGFNFDQKRFADYSSKIMYRTFDSFDEEINNNSELLDGFSTRDKSAEGRNTKDWIRERFQGNYQVKLLKEAGAKPTDLVLISSADEIISEDAFNRALERFDNTNQFEIRSPSSGIIGIGRPIFGFMLDLYVYKFNLFCKNEATAVITEFGTLQNILPTTIQGLSMATHDAIPQGGWHFAWLDKSGGLEVLQKQKSWAHSRDRVNGHKTKYENNNREEALERLFTDYKVTKRDISADTHPSYLINNIEKYKAYIQK